ncbi:hypothetical protein B6U79_02295 [Candidatus Bathyarchaeota archaeon ex4484_231]|nr:MAG: hypothetical protein B6U79_02295 [Candidatus Bathyarchaeota archaeon ex4484_231]
MKVEVSSSARLHFGFYTISTGHMAYGSIGVAISEPTVTVQVSRSDGLKVRNLTQVKIEQNVKEVLKRLKISGAEVTILNAIPRHLGLGSTTQSELSIAYAVSKIYNRSCNIRQLAFMMKRGWVSGIGTALFEHGGFVLDTGRLLKKGRICEPESSDELPRIMYRSSFPRNWYFIVAVPKGIRGFDEREEKPFLEIPESNPKIERQLHEAVLLHMLPALARKDAETFGKALTKVQLLVGKYFSKHQHGEFCCWETEQLVKSLLNGGAYGAGQSSWGPTAYGMIEGQKRGKNLLGYMLKSTDKIGVESELFMVQARNRGFSCKLVET